ncbi:MAG: DUF4827 domain-containing protein [Bacteroidales bacterium]|nr:DUF4827 domain-containing protein [Bacteroidales bacterium]
MKRLIYALMALFVLQFTFLAFFSCSEGETYADMKEKEKNAINKFIDDNEFTGPIRVITENEFYKQDSLTDTTKNEFVQFSSSGIYMQIVRKGEGKTMIEMAKEDPDSTITQRLLCRFLEYDIESGDTINANIYKPNIVDKLQVKYSHQSRSYTASFTEGDMMNKYGSSVVPTGWLKPLDFIRLTRNAGRIAKVRLIVPHSSGTSNASGYVLPMYYEISYQLGY